MDMQYPYNVVQDDYPIYAEIEYCIQQLQPLQLCFIHHQDKKLDKPLTLPEWLNIDCDVWAAQLPPFDNPEQLQQNPQTAASHPHLCINGHIIIRQLQATLHDAECKTPTSNTCRINSTGPHHPQIQSSGKLYN